MHFLIDARLLCLCLNRTCPRSGHIASVLGLNWWQCGKLPKLHIALLSWLFAGGP